MLAALNTDPAEASAALAAAVVRETLALGGRAYAPRIADPNLEAAFVAPALARLERQGAEVRLGTRVDAIDADPDRVRAIRIDDQTIPLGADDRVVLATPAWITPAQLPGTCTSSLLSIDGQPLSQRLARREHVAAPVIVVQHHVKAGGRQAQLVFAFEDRISVTVSGADAMAERPREEIAALLWADVAKVHGLDAGLPPWRIVKERRATFAATPEQAAKRPPARTRWRNLALAGDWTDTGLPATIEGAIRSGHKAAEIILS